MSSTVLFPALKFKLLLERLKKSYKGKLMNLETVANKQLSHIEQLAQALAVALVKAKLGDDTLCKELERLVHAAGDIRRNRFDRVDSEYKGF
jgi:hypothetical protein